MITCSNPPEGAHAWILMLIEDKMRKLAVIDSISTKTVRRIKKHLKPWHSEQWCMAQITDDYLWHMEDVLSIKMDKIYVLEPISKIL